MSSSALPNFPQLMNPAAHTFETGKVLKPFNVRTDISYIDVRRLMNSFRDHFQYNAKHQRGHRVKTIFDFQSDSISSEQFLLARVYGCVTNNNGFGLNDRIY